MSMFKRLLRMTRAFVDPIACPVSLLEENNPTTRHWNDWYEARGLGRPYNRP